MKKNEILSKFKPVNSRRGLGIRIKSLELNEEKVKKLDVFFEAPSAFSSWEDQRRYVTYVLKNMLDENLTSDIDDLEIISSKNNIGEFKLTLTIQ